MEKDRINILIKNPSLATPDDLALVERQLEKYPFSQVLSIFLARLYFQLNEPGKDNKLRQAAIHSANRSKLKEVIYESKFFDGIKPAVPYQDLPAFEINSAKEAKEETRETELETDSSAIFDEVLKNLEKLKSLRKQFQFLETDDSVSIADEKIVKTPEKKKKETKKPDTEKKPKTAKKKEEKPQQEKEEKITELLEHERLLDEQVNEFFLKEIEKNKEPEDLKDDKQLSQNQIIEHFIKEQPSIGDVKKEIEDFDEGTTRDLSLKSTTFGDDLVSENLAVILLKQGKKEKAIDIYKKLIWKLPQKKAYFAARIEEIKK